MHANLELQSEYEPPMMELMQYVADFLGAD
jgi:hypothetical protein